MVNEYKIPHEYKIPQELDQYDYDTSIYANRAREALIKEAYRAACRRSKQTNETSIPSKELVQAEYKLLVKKLLDANNPRVVQGIEGIIQSESFVREKAQLIQV